jgi:hypothetical protein
MHSIGRHVSRLWGYAPALPTPFAEDGEVDGVAKQEVKTAIGLAWEIYSQYMAGQYCDGSRCTSRRALEVDISSSVR